MSRYLYAVVYEITPRDGETLEDAWNRHNRHDSTDHGEPIFATGVLDASNVIAHATFDVEVIADDPTDQLASCTVLPVPDEDVTVAQAAARANLETLR